jgi:hypothetical protein
MFQSPKGKRRGKGKMLDGRPLPRISELIMSHVQGTPSEKLTWLQERKAAGKLDGDDPDEVAEAEALLAMLVRMAASQGRTMKKHLDQLLDEGLRQTFPASDPVSVGHFTSTEFPNQPVDRSVPDLTLIKRKANRR